MKPALLSSADPVDERPVDCQARGLLLCFVVSALLWLMAGTALALVHLIQLHTPSFFADTECFSFGRTQAAAEASLIFGWAANGAFASALWVLGRLGGSAVRGQRLGLAGALFWNAGVSAGIVGILAGEMSGRPLLQMPAPAYPLLIVAAAAIGTCGLLSWADRRHRLAHAAQGYAVASLFGLPWILSVAAVMLFYSPQPGLAGDVVAAWCGSNLLSLWLVPAGLALLYYLVPKFSGSVLPNYSWALGGFWTLMVFAPWAGTRDLAGGPFPVWIPTVGIAASLILLIHIAVVAANLRLALSRISLGIELKLLALSSLCYVLGIVLDVASSLRAAAVWMQFTQWTEARQYLFLFGFLAPAFSAAFHHLVPRLLGRAWASEGLAVLHLRSSVLGVLLLAIGLGGGGIEQALALADTEFPFAEMSLYFKPWLLCSSGGIGLQLLAAVLLFVNLLHTLLPATRAQARVAQGCEAPGP